MNYEQLKNSILQEAIEGRLVKQNPNDEPASVLLDRIADEKKQLIKEKKIKRDKNESRIYRTGDGHWMERFSDKNRPEVCIDDEIPFDIPESWEWCRLKSLVSILGDGIHGTPKYDDKGDVFFINGNNLSDGKIEIKDDTKRLNHQEAEKHKRVLNDSTILVSINGTIGNVAFYNNESVILGKSACYFNMLGCISKMYIKTILNSKYFLDYAKAVATGSTIKNVPLAGMRNLFIPLPPLQEQHRIVSKLEELLPKVEEYGKAQDRLDALNAALQEKLKASILQEAIEGRLVPQNPDDEPASKLLDRIAKEKANLIKEKKIKADKNASRIYRSDDGHWMEHFADKHRSDVCIDDEIPFDIPESWELARLASVTYNHGQKKPEQVFSYIDIGSINNTDQKLNSTENIIQPDKAPSRARKIVKEGDIIYATVRPYLHNMCIINKHFSKEPIASTGFAVLACYTGLYNKFLFYYMLSPIFDEYANDQNNSKGIAYPAINDQKLYRGLVPIPPLEEQRRIVSKLEQILPKLSSLK